MTVAGQILLLETTDGGACKACPYLKSDQGLQNNVTKTNVTYPLNLS
jgi:hypothetical protein